MLQQLQAATLHSRHLSVVSPVINHYRLQPICRHLIEPLSSAGYYYYYY